MRYHSYIGSSSWRQSRARRAEFVAARRRCRICNARGPLEAHHRTYRRLGRERASDLTALCRECHAAVTDYLRRRRHVRRRARAADVIRPLAAPSRLFER